MKVLLCAIGKYENHYVREWVEHYQKIGFDNICLYDNNDVDGERFEDVIGDYVMNGFVIIEDIRGKSEMQHPCYWDCYHRYGKYYDWIAFFDLDEFLRIDSKFKDVKEWLSMDIYKNFDAVRVCWKMYTDSGILRVEDDNYSITRFTEWNPSKKGKSIIRTGLKLDIIKAHGGSPLLPCNTRGEKCLNDEIPSYARIWKKPVYENAWLDHYRFKTIEEFVRFKMFRLYPDKNFEDSVEALNLDLFFVENKWTNEKKAVAKEVFKELNMQNNGYTLYRRNRK